jgi:UDP-N-acetylmuramate-alanine ligase
VIDDYGHHPAEMAATIDAVRGSFQGAACARVSTARHAHARPVRGLVAVLATVDALVLTDVYPAGEPPIVAAGGRALARRAPPGSSRCLRKLADVAPAISAITRRRRRRHDGRRIDRAARAAHPT